MVMHAIIANVDAYNISFIVRACTQLKILLLMHNIMMTWKLVKQQDKKFNYKTVSNFV